MPQKHHGRGFPWYRGSSYPQLMKSFRVVARAFALAGFLSITGYAQTVASPQQFLDLWGKAWEDHDVDAIMKLHADDCSIVNRFGVIANGKDEIRRSMTWLHNGPFRTSHFAVPKMLDQHRIAPGVVVLHASWKNPSGRTNPPEDDLVITVVLRDFGGDGWLAEEIDTHTVEPLAPSAVPETAPAGK